MNRTFQRCWLIAVALLVVSAVAATTGHAGCQLQGTWIMSLDDGGTILAGTATYSGQSAASGTSEVEFPALGPVYLGGDYVTSLHGVWERTGGNTFDFTLVGYAVEIDENGVPAGEPYLVKSSGSKELSPDCNSMTVYLSLEADGQCVAGQGDPLYATRVAVEPTCEIE